MYTQNEIYAQVVRLHHKCSLFQVTLLSVENDCDKLTNAD